MRPEDTRPARLPRGVYVATVDGINQRVYVAGPPGDRWAFWNGQVFHSRETSNTRDAAEPKLRGGGADALTAPMPATVIKVLVVPGAAVTKGKPLVVLEAMKMELPIRAFADGRVKTVHCREGELVQADQLLVEME